MLLPPLFDPVPINDFAYKRRDAEDEIS